MQPCGGSHAGFFLESIGTTCEGFALLGCSVGGCSIVALRASFQSFAAAISSAGSACEYTAAVT